MSTAVIEKPTAKAIGLPQFSVQRADLVRELTLAHGAVERKTTIPILANVKLEAEGSTLRITATDLDIAISMQCEASVKKAGAISLPARRLLDYCRLLPDGPIDIKLSDSFWASITSGRAKTRIAGMSIESFPELPPIQQQTGSIPLKDLMRLVQQTTYAITTQETRFVLNGALMDFTEGHLRMVATDGHRLVIANGDSSVAIREKVLVPRNALLQVIKLAGAAGPESKIVGFGYDDNHLFFSVDGRVLSARKLHGNFPDYARVLPASFQGTATVNRQQFRAALSRVRTFADERSRSIRIAVTDGQIGVFSQSLEAGESEETVSAEVSGRDVTIGFNADYLVDFLETTEAEKVVLSYVDSKTAMQLAPVGEDGQYLCVVMPMRI